MGLFSENWAKQCAYGALTAGIIFSATTFAEDASNNTAVNAATAGTSATAVPATPSGAKIVAGIDVRPSWDPTLNVFRTEDAVEMGYQFKAGRSITYIQTATTNIHTPNEALGANPLLDVGYLRTGLSNLLSDSSTGLSFGYQNRIYIPTAGYMRDAGQISMVRNYFNMSKRFNNSVVVTLTEMPVFHFNSRAGTALTGAGTANSSFQNRIYLTTDIQITDNLSVSFPVMFHQTKYANFQADAMRNNSWDYLVWTYPEITYSLGGGTSVGFAYYSANLVKPDLSDLDLEAGLSNGTFQVACTAYL